LPTNRELARSDRLQNKLTDSYLFALPISVSIHSYSR